MNRLPGFQIDTERFQGIARHGRWRFVLLILVFNILLITTLLLSMHHQELIETHQLLETQIIYQELLITQEVIESVIITVVVPPGFTPQATPIEP